MNLRTPSTPGVVSSIILLLIAPAVLLSAARAQEIDTCLECHEDDELTKNRGGRVVSLYFDQEVWEASVHGIEGLECSDCHADLADAEFPHPEDLEPPVCGICHDDVAETVARETGADVAVLDPLEGLAADAPTIRDPDRRTYFKEEVGGLVMGGYEPNPQAWEGINEAILCEIGHRLAKAYAASLK